MTIAKCILLLVLTFGLDLSAASDDRKEALATLRALGLNERQTTSLLNAIESAEERESIEPLKPFFAADEFLVAFVAAAESVMIDRAAGMWAIRGSVEAGKSRSPALLMALCFAYDEVTIDYLVARLQSETVPQQKSAIVFALRVLTQKTHREAGEWKEWWAKDREIFEVPETDDLEEQGRRMRAASTLLATDELRKAAAIFAEPNDKKLAGFSKLLGDFAKAREAGLELRLSAEATEADALFSRGQMDEALQKYAEALTRDPEDVRSRFVRACLLFELGRLADASGEFAAIAAANKKATSAQFLHRLAERRLKAPSESLLTASLEEFADFEPRPEMSLTGWSDPIMDLLLSQSMAGAGIKHIEPTRLDALVQQHPTDLEIALGAALLGPNAQRRSLLQRTHERFPDSPLVLACLLQSITGIVLESEIEEIRALIERWQRLEPENAVPAYLATFYAHYSKPSLEDIKAGKRHGLPMSAVEEIARTNLLPRFERYGKTGIQAKTRVLRMLDHPFRAAASFNNPADFQSSFLQFVPRLGETAESEREEGDSASALEISKVLERLGDRFELGRGSMIDEAIGVVAKSFALRVRQKEFESREQAEQAAEARTASERLHAERKRDLNIDFFPLFSLPLPTLEQMLTAKMTEDEVGFFRAQPAGRKDRRKGKSRSE